MNKKTLILVISLVIILVLGTTTYFFFFSQKKPAQEEKENIENITEEQEVFDYPEPDIKSSRSNSNGPYYHQIYKATSQDGKIWTPINDLIFDHVSVPGAVIKDGVVFLYFVDASGEEDQLSVAISKDSGKTFEKQKVHIWGTYPYDVVDPHPILIDGKIRLFFLGDFMSSPKGPGEKFTIYSAESEGGIEFGKKTKVYEFNQPTTDPDVFKTEKDWRMLISQGRELKLFVSENGVTDYKEIDNFSWDEGGVCSTTKIGNDYITYYCGEGISWATGADKGKLTKGGIALDNRGSGNIICDPSVIQLSDGSYLMFYKKQQMPENIEPKPQEPF